MHLGDFARPIESKRENLRRILGGRDPCLEGIELHDIGLPPKPLHVPHHAAADGGRAVERLQGLTVYLVRGYAAGWRLAGGGYQLEGERVYADVGVVRPPEREETRVSIYSDILEVHGLHEVASAMPRGGLVLGDGSIISLIVEPRLETAARRRGGVDQVVSEAAKTLGYDGVEGLLDALTDEIDAGGPLASRRLTGVDESRPGNPLLPGLEQAYVEYLEKLILVQRLLKDAWEKGLTVVYLSKTSRTTFMYPDNPCGFPDVHVITRLSPIEPGLYAHPPVEAGLDSPLWAPSEPGTASTWAVAPTETLLAGFYQELRVYRFYLRMAPGAQVLKAEIPIHASEIDALEGDLGGAMLSLARSVAARLLGLPLASGYPVPLRRVHERAKLSPAEAEAVLDGLGVSYMVGGREVVEKP